MVNRSKIFWYKDPFNYIAMLLSSNNIFVYHMDIILAQNLFYSPEDCGCQNKKINIIIKRFSLLNNVLYVTDVSVLFFFLKTNQKHAASVKEEN